MRSLFLNFSMVTSELSRLTNQTGRQTRFPLQRETRATTLTVSATAVLTNQSSGVGHVEGVINSPPTHTTHQRWFKVTVR